MYITKTGYEENGWNKNGSGSSPTTNYYIRSVESLASGARSLITFIREI
jgi:hypothetical protein